MSAHYYRATQANPKRAFYLVTETPITRNAAFVIGWEIDREGARVEYAAKDDAGNSVVAERAHLIQVGTTTFVPYTLNTHYGWLEKTKGGVKIDAFDTVCLAGNPKSASRRTCGEPGCVCA